MAIPLIKAIRSHFPEVRITLLINRSTLSLFEAMPFKLNLHCVEELKSVKGFVELIRILKKNKPDVFIGTIPSNTIKVMLLPYLAKIPYRIKHRSPHRGSNNYDFLFHHLETIPENRHRIDCNLDLLKVFKEAQVIDVRSPLIDIPPETRHSIMNLLIKSGFDPEKPMMAIHPGCNPKATEKRWPSQNYVELVNQVQLQYDVQLLIIGGQDELSEIGYIHKSLNVSPLNLAGQLNLIETAAAISFCRFVVSNDSGIMHLATAVDIPVFAIFGPTNERHIGPYGNNHTVIRNSRKIKTVTVEQVNQALTQSDYGLKKTSPKQSISQNTRTPQ